jgi:hypothetical protein
MAHFPQVQNKTRSPRFRVRENETVRFNLGSHRAPAILHKLSLTGGLAEFTANIGNVTIAEIQLETSSGPVSGLVEFLATDNNETKARAFRFLAFDDADYDRLSRALRSMRRMGAAEID